jgi:hypothetical protein
MKYLAKVCQFHVHVRVLSSVHVHVLSVSVSISMAVSVFTSLSVFMSISVLFQFKYGAMNIYGRPGNYCILPIPKGPTRWRGNLKGLQHERGWLKSADNLGASPFKRDLSNDTTFSQTNLAGQSPKFAQVLKPLTDLRERRRDLQLILPIPCVRGPLSVSVISYKI